MRHSIDERDARRLLEGQSAVTAPGCTGAGHALRRRGHIMYYFISIN